MLAQRQTSVAADLAIWRCASPLTLPWADVTLEFTFISMPTSRAVTVSTVTLSMACNHEQGEGREKFSFRVFRFFFFFLSRYLHIQHAGIAKALCKLGVI